MDKRLMLLVGSSSPAPLAASELTTSRTPNKREKLYKKANVGNAKAKTRAQTRVTRNQKKEMLGFARRGIPDSFSDEEPEANENEGITRKSQRSLKKQEKQKGLQDRLKRLEEFRKQKQEKKVTDAKNKRPPFKTGVYHGFGKFDANSGFNNPWVKTNLKKGQVFVFKGNQGTTKSSQVKKGIPKPNILSAQPLQEVKQNIAEEFQNLAVDEENSVKPQSDKKVVKTPKPTPKSKSDEKKIQQTPKKNLKSDDQDNLTQKTPKNSSKQNIDHKVIHVTPKMSYFVDRGTNSDKRRQKLGKTPSKTPAEILKIDDSADEDSKEAENKENQGKGEKNLAYFKNIVAKTDKQLTEKCQIWEDKMEKLSKIMPNYEEICGNIRSHIGKANLLKNKKGRFEQFRGLIYNCEFGLGEKTTTCMDLQGFWEMIYFQVEDVEQNFKDLEALESKNWVTEVSEKKVTKPIGKKSPIKNKPVKPKAKASSNLRAMLAAKRKAMMDSKKSENPQEPPKIAINDQEPKKPEMAIEDQKSKTGDFTFQAGFFNLTASPKSPQTYVKSADRLKSDSRNALRKSILSKRVSASNGQSPFAIIAATKSIRRSMSRENSPAVKGQLDYDIDTEEPKIAGKTLQIPGKIVENGETEIPEKETATENPLSGFLDPARKNITVALDNLICFDSPVSRTPRRSTRLSSVKKISYKESALVKNCMKTPQFLCVEDDAKTLRSSARKDRSKSPKSDMGSSPTLRRSPRLK